MYIVTYVSSQRIHIFLSRINTVHNALKKYRAKDKIYDKQDWRVFNFLGISENLPKIFQLYHKSDENLIRFWKESDESLTRIWQESDDENVFTKKNL